MELCLSIETHLERSAMLHSRVCPRQVIGVRMARFACQSLNIDPQLDRNQIYVFMETNRCAADAVIAVTGASPTNGLMELIPYGKVAATFVNLRTNQAIRVSERQSSRAIAMQMLPDVSPWEAQLHAYQIMADDLLMQWESVRILKPLPKMLNKHSVFCVRCGDKVSEHSEVLRDGEVLCTACADGAYYVIDDLNAMSTPSAKRLAV